MAIWNAKQHLPIGYESLGIYKKYHLLHEARNLHFKQLFDVVSIVYPHYSLEGRFKACIRIRKGIINNSTRNIGHCWLKNKVYLEGYAKLQGKALDKKLFLGKIKFEDVVFI
ncbi:MAG: hypothetical protein LBG52_09240 [Candidatus Peribacteria bacterium]|nr:hypothetical protein [Candidatus Peribacteria bacterium]